MRRLLILTLPALLTPLACDSGGDDGGGRNGNIMALSGDATAGETVFTSKGCAVGSCHGDDGNSGMGTAPALSTAVPGHSDDEIINAVLDGEGGMPPQDLSDQEMADVLAWMRANF